MHWIVTSGATREPIDEVRFIGNRSTGRLGAAIAAEALGRGHRVRFVHAAGSATPADAERFRSAGQLEIATFETAGDLEGILALEVPRLAHPAAVVMAAAVADFAPAPRRGKIPSGREEIVLRLKRLPKIVDRVKSWNPKAVLVKFKLECGRSRSELLAIGGESGRHSRADLVVLNDTALMAPERHPALLFWPGTGRTAEVEGKPAIARALADAVEELAAGLESVGGGACRD